MTRSTGDSSPGMNKPGCTCAATQRNMSVVLQIRRGALVTGRTMTILQAVLGVSRAKVHADAMIRGTAVTHDARH